MITLRETDSDDPQFVALAAHLLNGLLDQQRPQEVYAIQIDHWFDHKWQDFSGQLRGAFGVWKNKITIPLFDLSRVVSQSHYRIKNLAYEVEDAKPLHLDQSSGDNMQRFITNVSSSGLFLWYSGETKNLDRASIMVYSTNSDEVFTWYASFVKSDSWRLNKVRGISRNQFAQLAA